MSNWFSSLLLAGSEIYLTKTQFWLHCKLHILLFFMLKLLLESDSCNCSEVAMFSRKETAWKTVNFCVSLWRKIVVTLFVLSGEIMKKRKIQLPRQFQTLAWFICNRTFVITLYHLIANEALCRTAKLEQARSARSTFCKVINTCVQVSMVLILPHWGFNPFPALNRRKCTNFGSFLAKLCSYPWITLLIILVEKNMTKMSSCNVITNDVNNTWYI